MIAGFTSRTRDDRRVIGIDASATLDISSGHPHR